MLDARHVGGQAGVAAEAKMHYVGLLIAGLTGAVSYLCWFVASAPPSHLLSLSFAQRGVAAALGIVLVVPWVFVVSWVSHRYPEHLLVLTRMRKIRRYLGVAGGLIAGFLYVLTTAPPADPSAQPIVVLPVWAALLPLIGYLPGACLYLWDAISVGRLIDRRRIDVPLEGPIVPS